MKYSEHVLLIGEGAEEFAFVNGHQFTEQDYFFTERRYEQLLSMKEKKGYSPCLSRNTQMIKKVWNCWRRRVGPAR
ncbi:isoaspartyl peptidase/L-asparaginase [Vibrio sinaloensis]|nr:isoaspartyl peptidase/L-asparaginase [Vibrio sinaloensis]